MKSYEKFISKESVRKIHENTLRIMEEVGVRFENERALDIFRSKGCKTDGCIVHIPSRLVEDALASVPSSFTVQSNIPGPLTLGIDSPQRYISGNVSNIYICDENGRIRKTTNEDNVNQFIMSATSPELTVASLNPFPDSSKFSDMEKRWINLAFSYKYSPKALYGGSANTRGLDHDSAEKLRTESMNVARRFHGIDDPHVYIGMLGLNAMSPLTYNDEPCESLFYAAETGMPIWVTPCAMPLLTAPPSVAGLMSTTNAEVLAGLTLLQLLAPGSPFLYGNTSGSTDMRSIQLCIGSPEAALIAYATAGLADLYKLPFRAGGSLCDAKDMDAQAGVEAMTMLYATIDSGANYIMHQAGTMGEFNVVSLEKYILDEEVIGTVNRILRGVNVTDETLCFDEVKKIGPRGNFLHGRTPKVYRDEFYLTKLFNKDDPNNWQNSGAVTVKQEATKQVKARLEGYTPPERTKEQLELIEKYLPEAYRHAIR